jgi:putative phosphoribosyl transferase
LSARKILEHCEVFIPANTVALPGDLRKPENATAIVLFAHGSGSSRLSPRNRFVADVLHEAGLATLLFDLLTPAEQEVDASTGDLRFNIGLLTDRLNQAVDWLLVEPVTCEMRIGLFGASTGAAAALGTAADRAGLVKAVVSRGGRPDLAREALPNVRAPTRLIVGGNDEEVLRLNREAAELLTVEHDLAIVPGAGHLFEEPGKLEEVSRLAQEWFRRHLQSHP